MYAEGRGVQRNGEKARAWFMRLADPRTTEDRGYMPWAQWSLGEMYMEGNAVPPDRIEAYAWLSLAGIYGEERPRLLSRALAGTMMSDELSRAQERLDELYVPQRVSDGNGRAQGIEDKN